MSEHEYEGLSIRKNLRFYMHAGEHLCFYQAAWKGNHLKIDVKTLNGDGRHIGFHLKSPSNVTLHDLIFEEEIEYKAMANETGRLA